MTNVRPARRWIRGAILAGVVGVVTVALVVVLIRGLGDDGWPGTTGIGGGMSDAEVIAVAGTNLRLMTRDRTTGLDDLQMRILGLLPLYSAGGSPQRVTLIARDDPATGRSVALERLAQSLEGFTAPTCLDLVRTRLIPLAHRIGGQPLPADAGDLDRTFAAAWLGEGVEAQAAQLIHAHRARFQ